MIFEAPDVFEFEEARAMREKLNRVVWKIIRQNAFRKTPVGILREIYVTGFHHGLQFGRKGKTND